MDILELMSKKMNFDYEIKEPDSSVIGIRHPDGKWSGLIGELSRGVSQLHLEGLTKFY